MSAIVISAVLLMVAVTGSFTGFFARSNILDSELKKRSEAAAGACADQAILLLANDPSYSATIFLNLNSLDVCRAVIGGGAPNIKIQATSSSAAVTNLYINFNATTRVIAKWEEVATF